MFRKRNIRKNKKIHTKIDLSGIPANVGRTSLLSLVPHLHGPDHVGGSFFDVFFIYCFYVFFP